MGKLDQICGGGSAYGPLDRQIAKGDMPIKGPWRHGSLKQYFANVQALKDTGGSGQKFDRFGGDDKQVDGATSLQLAAPTNISPIQPAWMWLRTLVCRRSEDGIGRRCLLPIGPRVRSPIR